MSFANVKLYFPTYLNHDYTVFDITDDINQYKTTINQSLQKRDKKKLTLKYMFII